MNSKAMTTPQEALRIAREALKTAKKFIYDTGQEFNIAPVIDLIEIAEQIIISASIPQQDTAEREIAKRLRFHAHKEARPFMYKLINEAADEIDRLSATLPAPQDAQERDAIIEECAKVADAKFKARVESGHPREASAARAIAREIRALIDAQPADKPAAKAEQQTEPEFSTDPDGELAIEWYLGDDTISISVGGVGKLSWGASIDGKTAHGSRHFETEPLAQQLSDEAMRRLIADDAFAMSFQTLAQYRNALLRNAAGKTEVK